MPPLYDYECAKGHKFDRFLSLKDYKQPQKCECGEDAQKMLTPTMINCDMPNWERYESPASGKLITSYKDRDRDMKEHGCVDYDPGIKEENKQRVKAKDLEIEKQIDDTVEREFENMPSAKKETLENELKHLTLDYERRGPEAE